ncbi:MAG: M48 family metalloprotease [Alcanivorax sp.]|nr:M48 family metalloprotease [Alcanivorax sp.]
MIAVTRLTLLFLLCLLSAAGQAQSASDLPELGDPTVAVMSADQEHRLGRAWLRQLRGQTPIMDDALVQEYVESLVYRLASYSDLNEPDLDIVVINSSAINAFAVPGGVIGLNAGLFLNAHAEDEVAGVVAHEIAHVSQRHFARRYLDSKRRGPAVLAAMLASIALAVAGAGDAGMAGMAATQAASIQAQLAYSRQNEYEADRVGMQTLANAGMDPTAMPRFFERMLEQQRYAGDPPEFLLTHPLTAERVADSRARARNLPHPDATPSLPFELVRARVQARYFETPERARQYFQERLKEVDGLEARAARYGLALTDLRADRYDAARQRFNDLIADGDGFQPWYQFGLMEVDLDQGRYPEVIERGRRVLDINPRDYASSLLMSRAYLLSKQPEKALPLLEPLVLARPGDPGVWSMAADAWGNTGDQARAHRARAEVLFLRGQDDQALRQMEFALKEAGDQFALRSKLGARRDEMERLSKEEF